MVDVGAKPSSHRVAVASGRIIMQAGTLRMIAAGKAKKGDVLGVARLAAIQAAKRTAGLIPLAHPLALSRVAVDFDTTRKPAAVGLLTIYDMVKAVDRGMTLTDVCLEEKSGGRSGVFRRSRP